MRFGALRKAFIVSSVGLLTATFPLGAQFTATVLRRTIDTIPGVAIDTMYRVVIAGDTLLAITAAKTRRIDTTRIALAAARQELALKDSLIQAYEATIKVLQAYQNHTRAYVTELEAQIEDLHALANTYKKLSNSGAWVTFEGAIGAAGPDTEPAILAGLGIRRLRIYGLLQKDNLGGMVGMSFPIW